MNFSEPAMVDVLGVGASSIDFVYELPATPIPDSPTAKLRISRHVMSPGGQTATTLCTCASLGLRTKYIGTIGNDANGIRLREALDARGVDVSSALVRDAASPYAVILIDEHHGERIVLWDRSPALALRSEDVPEAVLREARVVHVDDVDPETALTVAARARAAGAIVTSDIERVTPHTRDFIEAVTVAIFDEHIMEALAPGQSVEVALRSLRARHDQMLCATQGRRGATLLAGDQVYTAPGYAVATIDTTGAGDVFRGGFIAALLRGDTPQDILRWANAAAAVSCTRLGAIGGVPTADEIETLCRQG